MCATARSLLLLTLLVAGLGCGSGSSNPPAASTATPAKPETLLHQQLRSGLVQLEGTLETIELALDEAKARLKQATGADRERLQELVDRIDDCGATLAEHLGDPPTESEVAASFARYDEQRLRMIDDVNDSVVAMNEAAGLCLGEGEEPLPALAKLHELVTTAIEDLRGTLDALGGKEVAPAEDPEA